MQTRNYKSEHCVTKLVNDEAFGDEISLAATHYRKLGRQNSAPKIANFASMICKFCAPFLANSAQILSNISASFFSVVQLSVIPVYYPEYRGLLVHLS